MNATTRAPTKLDIFMSHMLGPEDRANIARALPRHVPMDRFERNLVNALMNTPKLLNMNPREVLREVAKIAALGLVMDSQLGEAYLIASTTGPQARIGYRGLIKLGRQAGDLSMIYAHAVHERDVFKCVLGDEKKLVHEPDLFGDRGEVVGYYAVVRFRDGDTDFEPMTITEINAIRDKSDGWKAFKAGRITDTPWNSAFDEMAKKTCIRRLMKRMPQSPDLATAFSIEDAAEHSGMRDVTPPRPALVASAAAPTVPAIDVAIPADAGKEVAPSESVAVKPPKPSAPVATKPSAPKKAEGASFPGADAELSDLVAWVEAMLRDATADTLPDVWAEKIEPHIGGLFPPDKEELVGVYRNRERELAP